MGYVPPRPTGMIVLPKGIRSEQVSATLTHLHAIWAQFPLPMDDEYRYLDSRHSLATSYRRYVSDLYGAAKTDWMPLLNNGLLACLIALPILMLSLLIR